MLSFFIFRYTQTALPSVIIFYSTFSLLPLIHCIFFNFLFASLFSFVTFATISLVFIFFAISLLLKIVQYTALHKRTLQSGALVL